MQEIGERDPSLPELKVAQLVRSPEPVIKGNSNTELKPAESLIQPYGEYTLVIAKGVKEIQIFDKQGKKIEGLVNNDAMVVDWSALRNAGQYNNDFSNMAIDVSGMYWSSRTYYKTVDKFPLELQQFIIKYIKDQGQDGNECEMPTRSWQLDTAKTAKLP